MTEWFDVTLRMRVGVDGDLRVLIPTVDQLFEEPEDAKATVPEITEIERVEDE